MELLKIPSSFEKVFGARQNLPEVVEFQGYKWIVGGDGGSYPIDVSDIINWYPLVVKDVLRRRGRENGEKSISVSLPAEFYYEDVLSGKNAINRIADTIISETGVKSVKILPQGIIALHKLYVDGVLDENGTTLIIDGGFNTVNVAISRKDENDYIIEYVKTYDNEIGIRNLLEKFFLPEIKQRYPEIVKNLQVLKDVFLTGEIDKGFKIIDVSNEKQNALVSYLETLLHRLTKDIEAKGKRFNQFAVIGGLSYYIKGVEIDTNKKYFIPIENGEFYTVMGMREYTNLPSIDFGFGDIKVAY